MTETQFETLKDVAAVKGVRVIPAYQSTTFFMSCGFVVEQCSMYDGLDYALSQLERVAQNAGKLERTK